jgi:L-lactate dehydrogenase complex protein LldG
VTDDARRETLARLRRSTRGAPEAVVREELAALPRPPAAIPLATDPALAFLGRVLENGGSIAVAQDRRGAVDAIGEYLARRHGQRRLVAGHDERLAALPWRDGGVLPRFGVVEPSDAVAVSYARCAVSESGSVLLWRDRDNPASNNLLPEDHIVLVDSATLVPRLEDCWDRATLADPALRPRGMMLISGPSATADIALNMVTGAHGPRCWHVVLIGAGLDPTLARRAQELAAGPGPGKADGAGGAA